MSKRSKKEPSSPTAANPGHVGAQPTSPSPTSVVVVKPAHLFKPGQSGNPTGRPKIIREFYDALVDKAYLKAVDALVRALDSSDDRVSLMAAQMVLDRLFGKANQPITVTGEGAPAALDLRAAAIALLSKVAPVQNPSPQDAIEVREIINPSQGGPNTVELDQEKGEGGVSE